MDANQSKSFVGRMHEQFRRPGQTIKEFAEELKLLTDKDRADFVAWFNAEGMPTDTSGAATEKQS